MTRFIAVRSEDEVLVHATPSGGNYGTLCHLSIDDDEEVGREVDLPRGAKIDCPDCIEIITHSKRYRKSDLAKDAAP